MMEPLLGWKHLFLSGLLFLTFWVHAQPELGECEQTVEPLAQTQLPKALRAWKTGNMQEAQRYLEKAVDFDRNYAHANYLLGELYLRKGQIQGTQAMWELTLKQCPDYKADLYFYLGIMCLETGKEKRGEELLTAYLKHPDRDLALIDQAEAALAESQTLARLKANPVPFDPRPVPGISTPVDEYLGCISPDMQLFFFTRRSRKRNKYEGPAGGTRLVEEFSYSEKAGKRFPEGEALPLPFNNNFNEGGPSITATNRELYFTVCQPNDTGYLNCDIWYSVKTYNDWEALKPLPMPINRPDSWESQPSVSANGDQLFFASNRKEGSGGIDLYYCERQADGKWGPPVNMGRTINTSGDEKTPFIHSDSRTLYFSSNGHAGVGGFDIFFTKQVDGIWQKPQNIGYPINNESDNLGLFVSLDGERAYFSTRHEGGRKDYDIFQFALPAQARPEQVALVKGSVKDGNGRPKPDAAVEVRNLKTNEVQRIRVDESSGEYAAAVRVSDGQEHLITVKDKGAAFSSKYVSAQQAATEETPVIQADLEIQPLEQGKEYRLNDIYFSSNSAELNNAAQAILSAFIEFMHENPKVKVEIQGHTDEVGSASANLELSAQRAKSVYDYLVQNGIESARLRHKGFGETRPVADNSTAEGKAQNRRTVFVITSQ